MPEVKDLPEIHKQILSLIGYGKDNARTVSYISKIVGLPSTSVREVISTLVRKHGYGIATSNEKGSYGYYFITNEDERQRTIRNLRSRAALILERANAISKLPLEGQKKLF